VAPAAILVLLPKCPACIAAWLAVAAGLGVSISTAATLRMLIVGSCVACLAWVAVRIARHPRAILGHDGGEELSTVSPE
jgi:threonine/homoserine/homoserine lactone efflux protein